MTQLAYTNTKHIYRKKQIKKKLKKKRYIFTRNSYRTKADDNEHWKFNTERIRQVKETLEYTGVDVGVIHMLVHVRELVGMKRQMDRQKIIKDWSNEVKTYPRQLIVLHEQLPLIDSRFTDQF